MYQKGIFCSSHPLNHLPPEKVTVVALQMPSSHAIMEGVFIVIIL